MNMYSSHTRGDRAKLSKKEVALLKQFQKIADEYFDNNKTFPIIKSIGYCICIDKESCGVCQR
jgi:hypothetical protein